MGPWTSTFIVAHTVNPGGGLSIPCKLCSDLEAMGLPVALGARSYRRASERSSLLLEVPQCFLPELHLHAFILAPHILGLPAMVLACNGRLEAVQILQVRHMLACIFPGSKGSWLCVRLGQ